MQDETKKNSWGGARAGAGRKKKPAGKYYTFRSSLEVEPILESLSTSKSDFINAAILAYVKSDE